MACTLVPTQGTPSERARQRLHPHRKAFRSDRFDRLALASAQGLPFRVVQKGWQLRPCHVIPMLLPCCCHVVAMLLPCHSHAIVMIWPSYCHVMALLLPHCHVIAMSLPCCCHVSYHCYHCNDNYYFNYCYCYCYCCCCCCYYFRSLLCQPPFLPSIALLLVSPTRLPYLLFLPLVSIPALASYSTMLSSCSCILLVLLQAGGEEVEARGKIGRDLPLPPPRALSVPARGAAGAWLLTESHALEKLADVLEARNMALDTLQIKDKKAFLPFKAQKEVQERFFQRWLQSEDGKHFSQVARKKTSSQDGYKRTLQSYYRKSQYEDYGGRLWQYCLLALGHLPERQELKTKSKMNVMPFPDEWNTKRFDPEERNECKADNHRQRGHCGAHQGQRCCCSLFHGPCVNTGPLSPCKATSSGQRGCLPQAVRDLPAPCQLQGLG